MLGLPDIFWVVVLLFVGIGHLLATLLFVLKGRWVTVGVALVLFIVMLVVFTRISDLNRSGTIEFYVTCVTLLDLILFPEKVIRERPTRTELDSDCKPEE
ncbi:MAG: hypothetical protein K1X67_10785 [Fimbriimonadaceae bacterium]|nr:hypothetical protein [Fimbriimonadaceae bacterium]